VAIERREHRLDVVRLSVDRRLHEFVLGLEAPPNQRGRVTV
jgi:hypothetical protein